MRIIIIIEMYEVKTHFAVKPFMQFTFFGHFHINTGICRKSAIEKV